MGFLVFIWNILMRVVGIFGMILMEAMVFGLIYMAVADRHPFIANILAFVFVIFIIVEVILRIFVGGGVGLFKFLISRFF